MAVLVKGLLVNENESIMYEGGLPRLLIHPNYRQLIYGKKLLALFTSEHEYQRMNITVVSFGFKYGIPLDADMVFDVRFLPNPFYVESLRRKSGAVLR